MDPMYSNTLTTAERKELIDLDARRAMLLTRAQLRATNAERLVDFSTMIPRIEPGRDDPRFPVRFNLRLKNGRARSVESAVGVARAGEEHCGLFLAGDFDVLNGADEVLGTPDILKLRARS